MNPYKNLPNYAFWKTGVAESYPDDLDSIYVKKWTISANDKIATAGSCFAQHITKHLKKNNFSVIDVEPSPSSMNEIECLKNGYGLFSARYGNIYTVHQLLQLATEINGSFKPLDVVWERNGRFYDSQRPSVNPKGLASVEEVVQSRIEHLDKVKIMFDTMDVFIFTLGLTESWIRSDSGMVFPTVPGLIAGEFNEEIYKFKNYQFEEILQAFNKFQEIVRNIRNGRQFKILLTVSPVPLTATASGHHVLLSSTYSKAILRAVAGQLSNNQPHIDYFPSYEIITNPANRSSFYDDNLRTVKESGVEVVMKSFFEQHNLENLKGTHSVKLSQSKNYDLCIDESPTNIVDIQCEEALLGAFNTKSNNKVKKNRPKIVFIGDSHLAGVTTCVHKHFSQRKNDYDFYFIPTNWLTSNWHDFSKNGYLTKIKIDKKYNDLLENKLSDVDMASGVTICLVGLSLMGDGIIRANGDLLAGHEGLLNGRDISPTMPEFHALKNLNCILDENANTDELDFLNSYQDFYNKYFNFHKRTYCALLESNIYKSIFWIASPNMTENVARYRLGDEYVNSKSQIMHNRIAQNCFKNDLINQHEGTGWVITHPESQETRYGFSDNKFKVNDTLYDIHTNYDFYTESLRVFFELIKKSTK